MSLEKAHPMYTSLANIDKELTTKWPNEAFKCKKTQNHIFDHNFCFTQNWIVGLGSLDATII